MRYLALIVVAALFCCSQQPLKPPVKPPSPQIQQSSIAWDQNTLRKVSTGSGARYSGYARLVQLADKSLLAVYEDDGSVVVVNSRDWGNTWSAPIIVAARQEGINMAVPDVLDLADHSILVCYNPRPYLIDPSRKFGIRTKKSTDGGKTWLKERLLYEAGYTFDNGCWEPSALHLPDGEILLFFANEGVYTNSNEQNISMLRSTDNGLTWSKEPQIVSFRADSRDGMPAPLLLRNGRDLVFAIEDNGLRNFKPIITHSTLSQRFSTAVSGNSPERRYALADPLPDETYAGAPYLRQLPTGETLLSYQGTEGRINQTGNAEMKVVIGNKQAQNFGNSSTPFAIPADKSGLWNSLSVLADSSIVARTSTNAYSDNGSVEVWMIKGRLKP